MLIPRAPFLMKQGRAREYDTWCKPFPLTCTAQCTVIYSRRKVESRESPAPTLELDAGQLCPWFKEVNHV